MIVIIIIYIIKLFVYFKAPSSLLDALEQHLASIEGKKSAANTPTQATRYVKKCFILLFIFYVTNECDIEYNEDIILSFIYFLSY